MTARVAASFTASATTGPPQGTMQQNGFALCMVGAGAGTRLPAVTAVAAALSMADATITHTQMRRVAKSTAGPGAGRGIHATNAWVAALSVTCVTTTHPLGRTPRRERALHMVELGAGRVSPVICAQMAALLMGSATKSPPTV